MFRQILCPTDFSKYSDIIMNYAESLAERFDSHIYLLHCIEILLPDPEYTAAYADFEQLYQAMEKNSHIKLNQIQKRFESKNIPVTSKIIIGKPFVEIIKYAKGVSADLIIMGTHGASALSHILFGSTADKVVRKAPCPVMTVKHPDHTFILP
ncbi:universal stress protein [bacterium]|nr:universal stress protein [bacterium]MCP5462876.1 universal stress protein [bacterium]